MTSGQVATKNSTGARDPEIHQVKKGNQWFFGLKAHIGVDRHSGLVHTVVTTAAHVADVTQTHVLLHGNVRLLGAQCGPIARTNARNRTRRYSGMPATPLRTR